MASDYHARGRRAVAEARAALHGRGGAEPARLLMEENPRRLLAGESSLDVPSLGGGTPPWRRVLRLGRG